MKRSNNISPLHIGTVDILFSIAYSKTKTHFIVPNNEVDAVGPSIHNINISSHPKEYMMDGMYNDE
jgi:hypothetical protein